jgi:hypothetical protein
MSVKLGLRIFEPKRDEVGGGWRKLHNEELYNLNNEFKENETGRACGMNWGGEESM